MCFCIEPGQAAHWLEALASLYAGGLTTVSSQMEKHTGSEEELPARPQALLVPNVCFLHTPQPSTSTSPCVFSVFAGAGIESAVDICLKIHTGPSKTPPLEFNPILKGNRTVESKQQSHEARGQVGGTGSLAKWLRNNF